MTAHLTRLVGIFAKNETINSASAHDEHRQALKSVESQSAAAGPATLKRRLIKSAALVDPVQLRKDSVTDGGRLDGDHCGDDIREYAIGRSHELPFGSVSDSPPESGHKGKDAAKSYENARNLY